MARTVDPEAHAQRRDAFIDAAQRLIETRGYEAMSVQDVLAATGASKGAFYHYFTSKEALLDAVVARLTDTFTAALAPVVAEPGRGALEKLRHLLTGLMDREAERRDLVVAIGRVWMSDQNAVVRDAYRRRTAARLVPLLAPILRQGANEGTFSITRPELTAEVLVALMLGAGDIVGRIALERQAGPAALTDMEAALATFAEAYERVLGLAPGSWPAPDPATIRDWFD